MRQRRPKNLEEKINNFSEFLAQTPHSLKGRWHSIFDTTGSFGRPLFLEIGSGKGRFINELALLNPDDLFLGFEGQDTVIIRALEKISENELSNLKMCQYYINDFDTLFDRNELDGIYLNFSDPWPKGRHEKRRLTSPKFLAGYANGLKVGGFIKMKTDNGDLFSYSMNQLESHNEFDILEFTNDLHGSEYNVGNIMTEYEKNFLTFERKINYLSAKRK